MAMMSPWAGQMPWTMAMNPFMGMLYPQGQYQNTVYGGNPFLNMYVPAPNPSALTLASQMPPAGPGAPPMGPTPPPTSATLTPGAAAPGATPQAQSGLPPIAGMAPGIPGAGGAGLPATGGPGLAAPPPPPLPPSAYVAQQQAALNPAAATPAVAGPPAPMQGTPGIPPGAPAGTYSIGSGMLMNPSWLNPIGYGNLAAYLTGQGPQPSGMGREPTMGNR